MTPARHVEVLGEFWFFVFSAIMDLALSSLTIKSIFGKEPRVSGEVERVHLDNKLLSEGKFEWEKRGDHIF